SAATPAKPESVLRINASSVGQSIPAILSVVCSTGEPVTLGCSGSVKGRTDPSARQSASRAGSAAAGAPLADERACGCDRLAHPQLPPLRSFMFDSLLHDTQPLNNL